MVDETEDETKPREFGGEVDAMSRIREKKQHTISKMHNMRMTDGLYVGRERLTYSDL